MTSLISRILVPTDFSEHSQRAAKYASHLAGETSAELHFVHVLAGNAGGQASPDLVAAAEERLQHESFALKVAPDLCVHRVLVGQAYQTLADYAAEQQIELIVMGTHGRSGLSHLTLGSVAERLVRSAHCPVLVLGPQHLEVSPATAATTLATELGDQFTDSESGGMQRMQQCLEDVQHVSSVTALNLLDQLRKREWLIWEASSKTENDDPSGIWKLATGVEFLDDTPAAAQPTATPVTTPSSAAVDLIHRARQLRATDIHLDPAPPRNIAVRLRIDGHLEPYCQLTGSVGEHLINQFKTLAEVDLAAPFQPQEGRLHLPPELQNLEVRLTTAPVAGGEAISLRLFDGSNVYYPLPQLGLAADALQRVNAMLRHGEGLVLVTGPTGSGKTTTAYSMLEHLSRGQRNLVSVEDPVEFSVPFVRQMNVDLKHQVTMTSGLRTILRMDPDVIFLGEIRDLDVAALAMRAASSGKYIISSLHTRSVAATLTALRDLGVNDRSAASNLTGIINQRLLRKLCPRCSESAVPTQQQAERFESAGLAVPDQVRFPTGCQQCRETGFQGRIGTFEVSLIADDVSAAIAAGASEAELQQMLRQQNVGSLLTDALTKAADGVTSFDEALGVHWLA